MYKNFYVKPNQCPTEELFWNRENGLDQQVEYYFKKKGYFIPDFFKKNSQNGRLNAFSVRHIPTYRKEDLAFFYLATTMFKLNPVWLSYTEDMYTPMSKPKTGNLILSSDSGKVKIACPKKNENKTLSKITTFSNENLISFHERMWSLLPEKQNRQKFDCSGFLKQFGNAKDYYFYMLSLTIGYGVLFKNFHFLDKISSAKSREFTDKIVQPAFEKVIKIFGVRPIIVQFSYQEGYDIYPKIEK